MGDEALDDLLLEAVGRRNVTHAGRKAECSSSRWAPGVRRRGPIQDDSSDDDRSDCKSENKLDDDNYETRGSSRRKEDWCKMSLKKRFESDAKEGEEDGDQDGHESELSFGSDLYKNEKDRSGLQAMTELDREMILHDRAEKRDKFKMRVKAGKRDYKQMKVETLQRDFGRPSSRMRSSVRESGGTPGSSKENALNELVGRRNKSQDPDMHREHRDDAVRERDRRVSARSRRTRSVSEFESESKDNDESSREDGWTDREASDEDNRRKDEPQAGMEDIKGITIRRSQLAKWFMEPFFEEVIVGCFVRIGIGISRQRQRIYRVCLVKNVDAKDLEKQYKFENRQTYKYLNCIWGDENSSARWQMARASDQLPTDKEILEMKREVDRCGGPKLSKASVDRKKEALAKVNSFVYNAATVKQMLQEKKLTTTRPSNIALEKSRITIELGVAVSTGDHVNVERLQARLKELEEFSSRTTKTKDAKALALAEMNRRNRFENFKSASDRKPVKTDAKAGEEGYDPLSRRWTRSQNYYKTDVPKGEKDKEENEVLRAGERVDVPLSQQTLGLRVSPVDGATTLIAMHDFDLQISLAPLRQMGGTPSQRSHLAHMARRQKLDACSDAQVNSNENSNGARRQTLTVNDYKRRRGLL